MARPLRIEYEDAFYHVMNRGRGRQWIYPSDDYYEAYLQCLAEAHDRFGIEIHAYCLMGNHYHLLIKTPRANLGRAMRHIDGIYTQRYNRIKRTDGPLFRGRYKAIVVDARTYLLQVSRYIHRNPIELKTPLVKTLETYPWSSYAAYINRGSVPKWLNRDTVYGELSSSRRYQAYRNYVMLGSDDETLNFYGGKKISAILGDSDFKEKVLAYLPEGDGETDTKGLKHPVPLKTITGRVASHFGISSSDIYRARRGQGAKNLPRWVAMKLCQQVGGATLSEMASLFNVGHYSTVSQTIGRLNKLLEIDKALKKEFNVLSQDLTP